MKKAKIILLTFFISAISVIAADDNFIISYTGPNIGGSSEKARKVCAGSVLDYRVRAAGTAVYHEYNNYVYINGACRYNYHPFLQYHYSAEGKNRLMAKLQTYRQYSEDTKPYATVQMDIILEDREDGVYAWVDSMYQANDASEWLYGRDLSGLVGSVWHSIGGGVIGYDWRDIDGTFHKGYGIDHLLLQRVSGPAKKVENDSAVEGDLVIAGDTAYFAEGETALADEEFGGDITVDGTLTIRNPGELVLSGNMNGMGDVTYEATELRTLAEEDIATDENSFLSKDWKTVATGRLLSSVTNIAGVLCGTRIGGDRMPAGYAHWRNDGIYAVVQVYNKISSSYQTGCVVYMRQSGANIQARITAHSYNSPYQNGIVEAEYRYGDIDFETMTTQSMSIPAGRVSDGDYTGLGQVGLHSLKLFFEEGSTPHFVRFAGKNTMYTGAVTRVSGNADAAIVVDFASLVDNAGLPRYGALEVGCNAHAVLSKVVSGEHIKAFDGGVIYQGTNQCIANSSTTSLILSNGTFVCGYQGMNKSSLPQGADSYMYLNHVAFYDGGRVVGNAPRIGAYFTHSPRWYVGGETPSYATCGMRVSSDDEAAEMPFVFEVEDVTGDENVDFTMSGGLTLAYEAGHENYEYHRNIYMLKVGPGTLSMEGRYSLYMPTVVSNGVWRFGVAEAADPTTDFKLDGGDLEVAPGVELTIGEVIPSVPSTITLGEGATISIKVPASDWGADGSVDFVVSGFEARSPIRIGEDADGISGYRGAITVNGRPVMQDANGYLVRAPFRIMIR